MNYSCSSAEDNPVNGGDPTPAEKTVMIEDDSGNKYEAGLVATFKGEIGQEVSISFGVYDSEDYYAIDFGDGKLQTKKVGIEKAGPVQEDGSKPVATQFTGTIAGNGTIEVYGKNDIYYLVATGNVVPTSFDQEKLKNMVDASFSGANVESIELPALEKLEIFDFNNSPVKTVDVSKVPQLKQLSVVYSQQYTGEMNLEAIDLKNNTELTKLSIQSQVAGVCAKLKEIDLSINTKLTDIYLPYNSLTKVILPTEFTTTNANDPSTLAKVSMFLNNNQLTAIDGLDKLPAKSTVSIASNLFTLATLPAKPANVSASKYTYVPQPAYEVAEAITDQNNLLDLSSQLTATGVATEPQTTTYTFFAGTTELKENEDYKVVEPGKFTFLKSQTEKVHAVMATKAFPKFTGNNAYKTTEFTVTVTAGTAAEARIWDFTRWSDETIANLKADAANSKISGWSDVEKKADAEADADPTEASKDNCFWLTAATTDANGKAITELKGLVFDADYCAKRSLAIAVNYPKALSDYAGGAYLWLGGGGSKQTCPCFTIPAVKAGQKITFVVESHKTTDARGIGLYKNSYDSANLIGEQFKPTTKASNTWEITEDCDVVVWNTSGCHIYSIEVK